MSRLPIRWRLTLAFGLALAVVLTAVGIFLQARLHAQLDLGIERDLRARAGQLGGLLTRSPIESLPQTPSAQLEPDENIAQILRPDGSVVCELVRRPGAADARPTRGCRSRRDHRGPAGRRGAGRVHPNPGPARTGAR